MLRLAQMAFRKGSFNRRTTINRQEESFWGVIWRETFVKFRSPLTVNGHGDCEGGKERSLIIGIRLGRGGKDKC